MRSRTLRKREAAPENVRSHGDTLPVEQANSAPFFTRPLRDAADRYAPDAHAQVIERREAKREASCRSVETLVTQRLNNTPRNRDSSSRHRRNGSIDITSTNATVEPSPSQRYAMFKRASASSAT